MALSGRKSEGFVMKEPGDGPGYLCSVNLVKMIPSLYIQI